MKNDVIGKVRRISESPLLTAIIAFVLMAIVMLTYEAVMDAIAQKDVRLSNHVITVFFTSSVAFALAYAVSNSAAEFYEKYTEVEQSEEVHRAGMTAAMHYLNNAVTTFQLIELEVEMDGSVSEDTLRAVRKTMESTTEALKTLSTMNNPTADKIYEFIKEDLKKV